MLPIFFFISFFLFYAKTVLRVEVNTNPEKPMDAAEST